MGFNTDFMLTIFPILFMLTFGIIFVTFIVIIAKGLTTWNKNNKSPVLDVRALVVAKRTDFRRTHSHSSAAAHSGVRSRYFITFEVESRDRMELLVDSAEFGMIAEGDKGILKFQGTRFLSFNRVF